MQTVTGRDLMISVGYRLPADAYNRAVEQARAEGVKLSKVLRRATIRGLETEGDCRVEHIGGRHDVQ